MHTYVKLKNRRLMIVQSDNTDEKTMHGYPIERQEDWDVEWDTCDMWKYDDIEEISNSIKLDPLTKKLVLSKF